MTAGTDADPADSTGGDAPAETEAAGSDADDDTDDEFAHLDSLSDGAGCTEIWEHLSETREE
jgi:hypothetical protein